MIQGIDVSDIQGTRFSTKGISFGFVKATEGHTYTNPDQKAQAAMLRGAGAVVGFYHFLWPGNIEAQAEYFVSRCASVDGDLLACDWETTSAGTAASGAEKDAFLAAVRRLRPQYKVLLYCNRSFWLDRDTTSDCGDGLWIADPSSPMGKPAVQHPWTVHQYSDVGGLDRNVANFPTPAAMRAWGAATTTTTTTSEDDMPTAQEIAEAVWAYQVDDATKSGPQYVAAKAQLWDATAAAAHSDSATKALVAQIGALQATVAAMAATGGITAEQVQAAAEAGAKAALIELGQTLQATTPSSS
ncbi:glycoside hydrolase family 25 protein [Phaeacidiphilus oryzae]|uniref:glycoside hydrolase family 25 protein n=1 Tax=Phaeacidiphilus oryzae TaxID=348818 RepID=UPI0007C7CDEF|nr:GH25 family lysozyme [Phaeacidiphilus oryzae]